MSPRSSHYYCNIHKTVPTEFVGSRGAERAPGRVLRPLRSLPSSSGAMRITTLPDDEVVRDDELLASVSLQQRITSELRGFWQRVFGA